MQTVIDACAYAFTYISHLYPLRKPRNNDIPHYNEHPRTLILISELLPP